ncbi:unnamed protein product, partial [Staurois parvus]
MNDNAFESDYQQLQVARTPIDLIPKPTHSGVQPKQEQYTGQPRHPRLPEGAPVMYVAFTPSQAAALVMSLPDPEKQPMPFYCRVVQIQETYSAAWRDLISLCQIKAGHVFWPVMQTAFSDACLTSATSYSSGEEFCSQLHDWAKEKLADRTTTIQDITQDIGESVEKYHARLIQAFDDLGFSQYEKAHIHMLSTAFVSGLKEDIRK